ncbi:MAG: gamma subclass chorismate mutase AroQ [Hyphomicrobiales bacterium]|nr:gamma subclass chorismate mutase AroQ [Hyphomicrobiales bacterium]
MIVRLRFVVIALLLATTAAAEGPSPDSIHAVRLAMTDRLMIMVEVARFKWNGKIPIEDLEREAVVLEQTVDQAVASGVDPRLATALVRSQIAAAKALQGSLFEKWQADSVGQFDDAADLTETLRPAIGRLTAALIEAVAGAETNLADCEVIETLAPVPPELAAFSDAWAVAVAGVTEDPEECR